MSRVFPAEFRAQVVALYQQGGKTFAGLGREFGLSATTVATWVRQAEVDASSRPGSSSGDRAEIAALRRELAKKEEELEVLGKAVAFFARRMGQ